MVLCNVPVCVNWINKSRLVIEESKLFIVLLKLQWLCCLPRIYSALGQSSIQDSLITPAKGGSLCKESFFIGLEIEERNLRIHLQHKGFSQFLSHNAAPFCLVHVQGLYTLVHCVLVFIYLFVQLN